jgi:hypothetical protein
VHRQRRDVGLLPLAHARQSVGLHRAARRCSSEANRDLQSVRLLLGSAGPISAVGR